MVDGVIAESKPQESVLTDVVRYLQNYPFLLVTIAGLATLTTALAADLQKLLQFKLLLYAVILMPILLQFWLELRRAAEAKKPIQLGTHEVYEHFEAGPAAPQVPSAREPAAGEGARPARIVVDSLQVESLLAVPHALKVSKKAIFSIALAIFVGFGFLGGITDQNLVTWDLQLGLLIFESVPFGLGLAGFLDARKGKVSKPLATLSFITSGAMVVCSLILLTVALATGKASSSMN
jgi:hypothetical protein